MADAVIISAGLDSEKLTKAIDKLVIDVDAKMKDLTSRFDASVGKMEQSLNKIKETTSNSNVSKNTQEKKSVSELGDSYDRLASSLQAAAAQASKRWDVSAIQTYRMQLHGLESEMNRLWNLQLDAGRNEWMRLGTEIDATRTKIQQLRQEQEQIKSTQPTNRFDQAQLTQQYNQLGEQINILIKKEQQLSAEHLKLWYELAKDSPAAKQLKVVEQQYENVKQKIRELGNSMQQENAAQIQKTQELQRQEQILNRQVDSSRRVAESVVRSSGTGTYEVGPITPLTAEELQRVTQAREADHAALEKEIRATQSMNEAQSQLNSTLANQPRPHKNDFTTYDDLRQAIANVLKVQTDEVQLANTETASYKRLNATLNQLKTAYSSLSASERSSENGKALAASIHEVERALQKVKAQMSRPVSLREALGNPEKTLDDIIYKMQQLSSYRLGINVEGKGVPKEIQDVNTELERLEKRKKELLNQNQQVINSNNALTRSFNYMKNRLAFYFTIGASTQFVKNLIDIRSQYEMLEKSIGILVGSISEGSRIFSELNAMAIKSPFTTMELGAAAKQLTAYDVAANDVVNTTKRLADMAAAVGVPIQRLTYALGQVKSYDYLNARDARMFASAGIPLVKELAQYYTELEGKMVSTADIYSRMKKHMISYNDTMAVVNKMTDEGGKFFNYQEKMAGTLKVQLANLTLAWNNMLNSIGKQNQSFISTPIAMLKNLFKAWDDISSAIRDVIIAFGTLKAVQMAHIMITRQVSVGTALATTTNAKFTASLVAMRNGFVKLLATPMTWWMVLTSVIVSAAMAIWDANDALIEFNKGIRTAAKENVENLTKFIEDYAEIRDKLMTDNGSGSAIDKSEASKAWEAIKEEIELTSGASDGFISKLMSIKDINDRVAKSFEYLETIKSVSAALEKIGNNTIDVQQDYSKWWNIGLAPDSLFENVHDYTKALETLELAHKHLGKAIEDIPTQEGKDLLQDYIDNVTDNLKILSANLDDTYKSMVKFANERDWMNNPDAMNEFFGQIGKKLVQEGLDKGWEPADVLNFQLEWEELRSKASKAALKNRIDQELQAYSTSEDEKTRMSIKAQYDRDVAQYNSWNENNGRGKVLWGEFCKWMNDEHSTEVKNMYNKMTNNGTKAIDYSSKEWATWVNKMSDKFAKDHKLSQDDVFNYLKKWVNDANKWSIFIDLTISTSSDKSYYDTLSDLDKKADEAYQKRKRLQQRISELNKQGKKDSDEYKNAVKEETTANTEYNNAIKKGGHSRSAEADAKKAQTVATKKHTAAKRAEAKAESELQKALKDELQITNKVQSAYKKLTKAGVAREDALDISTSGFENSIKHINNVLKKYGITQFDIKKFAGVANPREMLEMLEDQLKAIRASNKAKPIEVKELEEQIDIIRVDAKEYDMKKITDGLNNELNKIKEEYELGVELEANPELGSIFADMMGISKDEIMDLPKDFQGVLTQMQDAIDKMLGKGRFDLTENLNKSNFDAWVENQGNTLEDGFAQALNKIREYTNKVRLDETKKIISEWDKLLEKYSEYEYKRTQIIKEGEHEREIAMKHGASSSVLDAINRSTRQKLAKHDFDEFQKSATWITATGNLSNLADSAIELLIKRITEYKKRAKDLEPKEILKLNKALRQLRKEQMKDNPFKIYSIATQEAKERAEEYDAEIAELQRQIDSMGLSKKRKEGIVITKEEQDILDELLEKIAKLKEEKAEAGEIPLVKKIEQVQAYVDLFKQFSDTFKNFADSTNNHELKQVAKAISDVVDVVGSALAGAKTMGGWWGAVIGGVTALVPKILDWVSGNDDINYSLERSQLAVKRLTNAYKELEYQAEKAYGAEAYGAQKALIINKQLQLAELERQLALEKSRKGKYRDESAIEDLKGQIIDLKNEINDATENIVNDLLGIASKGDFAENLVKNMISAFKEGEDYMKVFEDSFEDMVDNMIMKAIVSRLVGDWINKIWDSVNEKATQSTRAKAAEAEIERLERLIENYKSGKVRQGRGHLTDEQIEQAVAGLEEQLQAAIAAYNVAITPTPEDIAGMRELFEQGRDDFKNNFLAYMDAFGIKFGQSAGAADLSALQQGIQGITEDTAGALEAYMNGVSQQVYYQSDILTQIRDILINFGGDVNIATNAQILFELQQSYQVQMSIQSILQGWSSPSGLSIRAELIS